MFMRGDFTTKCDGSYLYHRHPPRGHEEDTELRLYFRSQGGQNEINELRRLRDATP
jgi:hypothetical protein